MYSAAVCVVLVIAGTVSGFVVHRSRRDLEQTILEVYGPPKITRPVHAQPSTPNYDTISFDYEKPKSHDTHSVDIDPVILASVFGSKKPVDESSVPRFYSTIIDSQMNPRRNIDEDLQQRNLFELTPPAEPSTDTETSTTSDETSTFRNEDRFLTEDLIMNSWTTNEERIRSKQKDPEIKYEPIWPEPNQDPPVRPGSDPPIRDKRPLNPKFRSEDPFTRVLLGGFGYEMPITFSEPGLESPIGKSGHFEPRLNSDKPIMTTPSGTKPEPPIAGPEFNESQQDPSMGRPLPGHFEPSLNPDKPTMKTPSGPTPEPPIAGSESSEPKQDPSMGRPLPGHMEPKPGSPSDPRSDPVQPETKAKPALKQTTSNNASSIISASNFLVLTITVFRIVCL